MDCAEHAKCTNIVGSYHCDCKPGYSGNGKVCGGKMKSKVLRQSDLWFLSDVIQVKSTQPK